jgi:peptide methionine sulfoxide reductase MsrB
MSPSRQAIGVDRNHPNASLQTRERKNECDSHLGHIYELLKRSDTQSELITIARNPLPLKQNAFK